MSSLYRSERNKIFGGVCGGLAEHLKTDPLLIRVIFIVLVGFGGSGILLYLLLWIILPTEHGEHIDYEKPLHHIIHEHNSKNYSHANTMIGFFIILMGTLFLLDNFSPSFGFAKFWPLLLIFFGVALLTKGENIGPKPKHHHPEHYDQEPPKTS